MKQKINLLLLAKDSQRAIKWQKTLLDITDHCFSSLDELPKNLRIEILLTDWQENLLAEVLDSLQWSEGKIGVILIGQDGSGDVYLPKDVTSRELRLAAQLLVNTVRVKQDLKKCERKLRLQTVLSMTDHLTGLLNRRALEFEMSRRSVTSPNTTASNSETAGSLAFGIVDLDQFKPINQKEGFLVGDSVLKSIAAGFQKFAVNDQLTVRLGGDEFVVMMPCNDVTSAEKQFRVMLDQLVDWVNTDLRRQISLSVGLVIFKLSEQQPALDELLKQADVALREAKRQGVNQIVCHSLQ